MEKIGEVLLIPYAFIAKQTEDPELPKGMHRALLLFLPGPRGRTFKVDILSTIEKQFCKQGNNCNLVSKGAFSFTIFLFGIDY